MTTNPYLSIKIQYGNDPNRADGLAFRVEGNETVTFGIYRDGLKIAEREFRLPDLERVAAVIPPVGVIEE